MKFIALYCMPINGLEEWQNKPAEERQSAEQKMQEEWRTWMAAHKDAIIETAGAGKTKRATHDGIADAKNDVMLYSIVEADSHEAAAEMFKGHPHLAIPGSWIDVMTANVLPGMAGM